MKLNATTLAALASSMANALPSTGIVNQLPRQAAGACASAVSLNAKTNVWKQYTLHPNSFYREEIEAAAENMSGELREQALRIADVGSFVWL
jgi:cellulose 1,4-beta-cellobiosidase